MLGKDVPEAAGAIGELCKPSDCQKLVDLLGKLPFDVMQSGLEPILLRPDAEIPEALKLDLLERLRELQTQEVVRILEDGARPLSEGRKPTRQSRTRSRRRAEDR